MKREEEINYIPNSETEEISLKELILKIKEWYQYLATKWLTILIAGILGGILGFTYAFFKKPVYTAETTFVLEEGESGGGLGAYAGIASMVGIDLGGGGGGIFKGDNILELYKSRRMIQETLLSVDTFDNKAQLLIERYIEFNKLLESWKDNPLLADIKFNNATATFTRTQDSIITSVVEDINKNYLNVGKEDKKLSIISVKVKSKDELFAKAFADNIVAKVNQFYVDTKTKKSSESIAILQKQADSVRRVLNASIGGVATAIDANPNSNPAFQRLRVGSQRKQIDVEASSAIYAEIVKNLELSKIARRKEAPLIQVIDEPNLPLKVVKKGKVLHFIIGLIISFFLTLLYLIIEKILK